LAELEACEAWLRTSIAGASQTIPGQPVDGGEEESEAAESPA
jgi:hypothetical protein